MEVAKHLVLLTLVSATVFFVNLGGPKLWDEDEPRNAGCAVEMIERGDWVTPYFNGEVRTHKPVLLYWFMISAYGMFGINEFSARFWSAALAVGSVLLTWSIGHRLLGKRAGLLSGLALGTMLMFVVAARAATPDSVLIFFITSSLAVYVWATPLFGPPIRLGRRAESRSAGGQSSFPQSLPATLLMYGLMGIASLDKGPIGFLLPCAIIGMFLLIRHAPRNADGRFLNAVAVLHPLHFLNTCRSMRIGWLIVSVLAVALPWYVWVTIRSEGEWTRGFFLEHNLGRAVNAMENHGGGPLYYPVALLVGTFPWSIFFIPLVLDLVRTLRMEPSTSVDRAQPSLVFLSCWVLVIVGLFSLASTKLPSYITPCYPAAAMLVGNYLDRLIRSETRTAAFWPYASFSVLAVVGVVSAVALATVATEFVPNATPLLLIGVVLVAGAAAAASLFRIRRVDGAVRTVVFTSVLFLTLLFGWGATRVSKHQEFDRIVAEIHRQSANPEVRCCGSMRSSWVYYLRSPIRPIDPADAKAVEGFLSGGEDRFVIATGAAVDSIRRQQTSTFEAIRSVPFFLEPGEELVLLHKPIAPRIADRLANPLD